MRSMFLSRSLWEDAQERQERGAGQSRRSPCVQPPGEEAEPAGGSSRPGGSRAPTGGSSRLLSVSLVIVVCS